MPDNRFSPFFNDGEPNNFNNETNSENIQHNIMENNNYTNEYQPSESKQEYVEFKPRQYNSSDFINNQTLNSDLSGNIFDEQPTLRRKKKSKSKLPVGKLLAILLPILLITNIATSVLVFNYVWKDANAQFQKELNDAIKQNTQLPSLDYNIVPYNVAKTQINTVLEVWADNEGSKSDGSGFIISSDGYFLTNSHVVTYIKKVATGVGPNAGIVDQVTPSPKLTANIANTTHKYDVEIINYDSVLDIALCKLVNASNLQTVEFGNSDILQYGEPCVAIGNAKGYGTAVTSGIISAPLQEFKFGGNDGAMTKSVQHSAAINPGNSGGPLFNMYGQIIGINTFKMSDSSAIGIDGMGFAIPSTIASNYVNGLAIDGLTTKVAPLPLDNELE